MIHTQQKLHTELLPAMHILQAQLDQSMSLSLPNDPVLLRQCREIEAVARQQQLPVRYAFCMETFAGHRLYRGTQYDWVVMEVNEHPLMKQSGNLPVPTRVLNQLQRIANVVEFDAIYIAEEVEPGSVAPHAPLRPEPFMPPPSRHVVEEAGRLGNWSQRIGEIFKSPWTWGIASGAGLIMALPLALTGLDPILFGLRTVDGRIDSGKLAAWHYLDHWAWNEEA